MRSLVLLLVCVLPAAAQEGTTILNKETPPHKMLHAYLLQQAQSHFDTRRSIVARLSTAREIEARQADLKRKFLQAIGDLPEKTPLNARTVATIKTDGYRIEKVIFESRPEHHVTGNLYIPEGKGPFPGVLVPCGHSANGKAADAYQRASILMALNGMVAFCYDPIGQGERLQLLDKAGKAGVPGSTSEHTMVGVGALLVGRCTANYRIWDGIRAMDYLASRSEVDARKLGCAGNSGGGTMTAYLMALDERIFCAVPSCYITSLERLFATIGPQDAEQNIPGQVAFGMEHADYLTMRAPLPTLMAVGTQDFFDIKGAWTSFREASTIYEKLGHADRMAIFEFDDKHGWSKPRREAATRWLRRWLVGLDDKVVEGKLAVLKDEDLQCTRSGQVLEDFRGVSAFHLNMQRDKELAVARARFPALRRDDQQRILRQLLGLPEFPDVGKVNKETAKGAWKEMEVETDEGIRLPAAIFEGKGDAKREPSVLVLSDRGMDEEMKDNMSLAERFEVVSYLDVRGLGRTAPGKIKAGKPAYFGVDMKEAFLGMHLGRPLLGQRVLDVLMARGRAETPVHIIARGPTAGLIALHCAALSPRVSGVTIEGGLLSWSNVVQTPISTNQLTNAVPGVLAHYDLPELATMIAPRPLAIRNPVDALGRPVSQKELEAAYGVTREHYDSAKAAKSLRLEGAKAP